MARGRAARVSGAGGRPGSAQPTGSAVRLGEAVSGEVRGARERWRAAGTRARGVSVALKDGLEGPARLCLSLGCLEV